MRRTVVVCHRVMLVFGRGLKTPASQTGDGEPSSHLSATDGSAHGIKFRQHLAQRETALKAFFAADKLDVHPESRSERRDRASRGQYMPGEWVMIWRSHENSKGWVGTSRVILQNAQNAIFCQHLGSRKPLQDRTRTCPTCECSRS